MLKKILSALIIVSAFFTINGAFAQSSKVDSSSFVKLRIDPQAAKGTKVSNIFENVNFIPLETKKESLFGRIARLKVIENTFLVYDSDSRTIFIFDSKGKYVNKIEANKIDDGNKTINLFNFEVQNENNEKVIVIKGGKYVFLYDLNGKFIKKADQKYDINTGRTRIENSKYSYQKNWQSSDSTKYGFAFFMDDKINSTYFPVKQNTQTRDYYLSVVGNNQENINRNYFITRNYDYNIYQFQPPKLKLNYQLIFPASYSLPADFNENPIYIGEANRKLYFENNKSVIYGLGNVHQFGRHLFFKVGTKSPISARRNALIYNTNTGELISIGNIEPDEKSYYLPITDIGNGVEFSFFGFLASDDKFLYTSYSSKSMFEFKDGSSEKSNKYNSVLTEYFGTQDKKSNPIIIQLKPKP